MSYTREQLLEAADILDKAHDVILANGWWPGDDKVNGQNAEARCVQAAILDAAFPLYGARSISILPGSCAPQWLIDIVYEHGFTFCWNDLEATEDEVFERLRCVAKELREEAGAPIALERAP